MSPQHRLILASILFAVLWTTAMYIWTDAAFPAAIILMIAGAMAGTLWFFAMRWYLNKFAGNKW